MKNWLKILIVISLLLSFIGFSNSYIMNSEIGKIRDKLVVIDRLNKDIVIDIALARMEFSHFMTNFEKSSEAGTTRLKEAAGKARRVLDLIEGREAKEKAAKVSELINKNIEFSAVLKKEGRDEQKYIKTINTLIALEKETFLEMTILSVLVQKEIDNKINNVKLVSSRFMLISTFLLVFVAGGIIVTAVIYGFISREQNEELTYYISHNLTDRETGLFNKMYFLARLKELLNKASRFKEEVTLVMVNVETEAGKNHLKVGALRAAGEAIKKGTRIYDIIARYENSVAVLLYRVGHKDVSVVLNRIKQHIEKNDLLVEYQKRSSYFKMENTMEKVKLTVDFDIMVYPADEDKIEFLLKN